MTDSPRPRVAGRRYHRGAISWRETIPALGVGIVVGLATFYVARLMMVRTRFERG